MNTVSINTLKALRSFYAKVLKVNTLPKPACEQDQNVVSNMIFNRLMDDKPLMIARFGSTELATMMNYLGIMHSNKNIFQYIKGVGQPWWWEPKMMQQMQNWSGFFPPQQDKIEQFCELMLTDLKEVDILGSWLSDERYFDGEMNAIKVHLRLLEPFWGNEPWTRALEGKKVLVIHPFAETIQKQYGKRNLLFKVKGTLPEFSSLEVIKAVQTLGSASDKYADWFEALDGMKYKIDNTDFDVCLIGAGAYGFPLAAHVKRIGKKAVHIGGALQLLFGIKGNRWEDPNYGVQEWGIPQGFYPALMNEYWIRPLDTEKPGTANAVEGACYW